VLGALILIQTTTILAGRDYDAPTQQVILGVLIVLFVATYARESHVRTRI
jgi:ribose/xylose/arabinose/galactoside ABC-type transport system permease subunit